ncbi:hypothetical protein MAPG_04956 [Magnaporthiopsis poae ATCC 64411]|uniref:Clr5 domain-containing protein n=1 Tax=Magnaporthiopsis poae (strain ATCC 64411 / 73-15) TaxID=644358 RepID=A0A0C4DY47_MAGP6|nr:hypothetical protein MAPG_04956 [Magnaporthiopsis poae ATCC 64411]
MAPPKISERQWLDLEPRIKELFRQHVPLKCKNGSRLTVSDILQQETGLTVTISQLEARLKAWNVAKKLKLSEWKIVMPRLERLEASGIKYRLLLADQQIKESAINRARRTLKRESSSLGVEAQFTNELDARQISIMIPGDGNQWVPYRGTEVTLVRSPSLPAAGPGSQIQDDMVMLGTGIEPGSAWEGLALERDAIAPQGHPSPALSLPYVESLRTHGSGWRQLGSPTTQESTMPSLSSIFGPTECNDHFFSIESFSRQPSLLSRASSPNPLHWDQHYPGPLSPGVQALSNRTPSIIDIQGPELTSPCSNAFVRAASSFLQKFFLHSATKPDGSMHSGQISIQSASSSGLQPEVELLLGRLLAILPEEEAEQTTKSSPEPAELEPAIRKMFLRSIVDNFAGLQGMPVNGVLVLLRSDPRMSSELFKRLRTGSQALAKTIADNLFRAAVSAGDAQAAKFIVAAGSGQPYAIRLDDIICQCGGKRLTPLELAANNCDVHMVSALVHLGADVNKSYGDNEYDSVGPLEYAVRIRSPFAYPLSEQREFDSAQKQIVSVLIEHGAQITGRHVEGARSLGGLDILVMLLGRLEPHTHANISRGSDSRRAWCQVAQHSKRVESVMAFRLLLGSHAESACSQCVYEFMFAFVAAAESGNLELCKLFLRQKLPVTALALSGAIRSGHSDIISLLLEQEIDLAEPPAGFSDLRDRDAPEEDLTTPLAEAIRSQNHPLVRILEERGVWSHVQESTAHFEAAALAAAEAGDMLYLGRIIRTIPDFRGPATPSSLCDPDYGEAQPVFPGTYLTLALIAAINHGRTQAIGVLLDAGAKESIRTRHGLIRSATEAAITQRNRPLVYQLLEMDVDLPNRKLLELAVKAGDCNLVKDLIWMRADVNAGLALSIAVESRNKEMVTLLLTNGAVSTAFMRRPNSSPLAEAIELEDEEMVELLLSGNLPEVDEVALLLAVKTSGPYLSMLLKAFQQKAPGDLQISGPELLIASMANKDLNALRALIAAGMDVNGISKDCRATPLGFAIQKGKSLDKILALVDAGADINSIEATLNRVGDFHGSKVWPRETALLLAINNDRMDVVRLLLERGAAVNLPALLGVKRTPLQAACEKGSYEIVQLLLDRGADVNGAPARQGGGTALQLAVMGGYIRIMERLLSLGACIHAPPSRVGGRTALEAAAEHGRFSMLDVLWAARRGAGFSEDEVARAISYANKNGHRGCAGYIWYLSLTQPNGQGLLKESGASSDPS